MQRALTTGLTDETKKSLDGLLKIAPEMTTTRLTWLRNASQSPAPTNILGLIERVEFLRKLGIDRERQQAIPASAFDRIAREALKISAQHLAEAVAPRRHALLTAAALSLETGLTDATLLMFDKLMGSLSRKAERRSQEKAAKSARDLQEKLRALTGAGTATAARAVGSVEAAKRYYRALAGLTVNGDGQRPELAEAKTYLAQN